MPFVRPALTLAALALVWPLTQACAVEVKDYPVGPLEGGSGGAISASDLLGAACESNADCGSELECFTEDLQPLGFPGGYCSKYCGSITDCPAGGVCLDATCALPCQYGVDSPTKCRGRVDVTCGYAGPLTNQVTVCGPMCSSDADCGGRHCDPASGACTDALPSGSGLPMSTCTKPDLGGPDPCRGCCTLNACIESCRVGSATACGGDPNYLCVPTHAGGTNGDRGICSPPCMLDGDCPGPGIDCSYPAGNDSYCQPNAVGRATDLCSQ